MQKKLRRYILTGGCWGMVAALLVWSAAGGFWEKVTASIQALMAGGFTGLAVFLYTIGLEAKRELGRKA